MTEKGRKRSGPGGVHKWDMRGTGEANLPQKLSLISNQERERVFDEERDTGGEEGGPEGGNEWERPDFLEVILHFRYAFVPRRPPLEGL